MAKNKEVKLIDARVTMMTDGTHVLRPTYIVTTEKDRREIIFNIPLNIWKDKLPDIYRDPGTPIDYYRTFGFPETSVNAGFGKIDMDWYLRKNKEACIYKEKILETFTHEMTIAEIEKKLGYKIKIVGEKEE